MNGTMLEQMDEVREAARRAGYDIVNSLGGLVGIVADWLTDLSDRMTWAGYEPAGPTYYVIADEIQQWADSVIKATGDRRPGDLITQEDVDAARGARP